MNKWTSLRLNKTEKKLLEKLAKDNFMNISTYIKKKIFEDNPDHGEARRIYHCPSSEKLNYIQVALAKQTQELVLYLLKKEYGEQHKEIFNQSFDSTENKLASQYNYKTSEVKEDE